MNRAIFMVMVLLCFYSSAFARRVPQIAPSFRSLEYAVDGDSLVLLEGSGREISIPLVVTDHHRGALYWLREQGLREAVLVNVDPHRDYHRDTRNRVAENGTQGVRLVHSGNWIEFAYAEGITSDIYWCVPHWFDVELQDQELGVFISGFEQIDWAKHQGKTVVVTIDLDSFSHRPIPHQRISLEQARVYLNAIAQNLIDNGIRPLIHISTTPNFTYSEDVGPLTELIIDVFSSVYGGR